MNDGQRRQRVSAIRIAVPLILLAATAVPARAFYSLRTPVELECVVRSGLAEAGGDSQAAIAWAESLAAVDPQSSFIASRVARLHEDVGEDMAALEWGERALRCDSTNAEAAMLVGRMRLRSGEPAAAVQVLTPPLRQLGAVPELYALRALAHELDRHYEAALADLKRTDVLLPDFAWIATGILGLALEDGRLEEAYSALQLALELRPGDPRTLQMGVRLAQRLENPVLEETLLRELAIAPESQPEHVAAYGAYLLRAGKRSEFKMLLTWGDARGLRPDDVRIDTGQTLLREAAYREALEAVKPLDRDDRAVPIRARAHLAVGEEKEALRGYRQLIPHRALTREESLVVAYLEIRVGDRRRGIHTLESVRVRPLDSPRQVLAASLCYSLLDHPEEAVSLIRESTARGLASPSIYEELGSAATVIGDSLLAQWAWERLRESGRETSECLFFLASAELAQGDTERALSTLQRAVQLNPRNGKALLLVGSIRYQRGQLELARETLILAASCPETVTEANRALARVCRALRLDTEAREAESRARSGRSIRPTPGISLFESR